MPFGNSGPDEKNTKKRVATVGNDRWGVSSQERNEMKGFHHSTINDEEYLPPAVVQKGRRIEKGINDGNGTK